MGAIKSKVKLFDTQQLKQYSFHLSVEVSPKNPKKNKVSPEKSEEIRESSEERRGRRTKSKPRKKSTDPTEKDTSPAKSDKKQAAAKGQLISKSPFGVFKSPKQPTKFSPGFLSQPLKRGQIKKVV